jgi:hypothetical protein
MFHGTSGYSLNQMKTFHGTSGYIQLESNEKQKYHTVRTITGTQFNRKIIETEVKYF